MLLMERCWTGVVSMLGLIRRLFKIEYVYSTALTIAHVCAEDTCQLCGRIADRQHMSVDSGIEIHGSTSQLEVSEWDCNIWRRWE